MMHHRRINEFSFRTYWQGIEIARLCYLESSQVWQVQGSRLCGQTFKTDVAAMAALRNEYGESR